MSAASLLFFSAFDKPSYRFIIAAEIPLGPSGPLRAPPTASLAAAFQSLLSMLAWHRRVTSDSQKNGNPFSRHFAKLEMLN